MEIIGSFDTSVRKALEEIDQNYEMYDALVVCGTHEPQKFDIEEIIKKISEARETRKPFLGLCFGWQLAAVEWARNMMYIKGATSEEWGSGILVVKKRNDLNVGHKTDGSYWNRFEVIDEVKINYEANRPVGSFVTQSHPEYESSYWRPHALLVSFLKYASNYKKV